MSSNSNRKVKPSSIKAKSRNNKFYLIAALAIVAVIVVAFIMFSQNNSNSPNPSPSPSPTNTPSTSPVASPSSSPSESLTRIRLQTSMGNITIQLRDTTMPITAGNFKNLTEHGVYDGTIFHRVISGFMIQGGDPTGTGYGDPSISSIVDEFSSNNHNIRGTIAMAKSELPNSASSQFFINVVNNSDRYASFDTTYSVFGDVVEGMDVVDTISNVATSGSPADKPLSNVTLIKAEVLP
jgi:cyclophilin family peptidyl-prolyl cis-trans isomerase